jgi:hypothetical protein
MTKSWAELEDAVRAASASAIAPCTLKLMGPLIGARC